MARPTFQSLRGMHDLLPPESARWLALVDRFRDHLTRAGYGYVRTPILEVLDVFARVGEGTDVVTKEMYDFDDRDGKRIALRPESTAGVARAFVQHHPTVPWKVWYTSEHFRHERPQAGRLRQHHQLGAEVFGSDDPDVDVELIVTLWDFYRSLGLTQMRLELNTIGEPQARVRFQETLRSFLRSRLDDLDGADRDKVETHPMRVLDSKGAATRAVLADAPSIRDVASDDDLSRHDRVCAGLAAAGIEIVDQPRLVRGLDYYTHTVFEIVSGAIDAAQSTIGGGGRYDGLVEALGGRPTPGVGFGSGIERLLLACEHEGVTLDAVDPALDAYVVAFGDHVDRARDVCLDLRRAGFGAARSFGAPSVKRQMRDAGASGARFAVLVGKVEDHPAHCTLRDLGTGVETRPTIETLPEALRGHR